MGVNYLQHRIGIGSNATRCLRRSKNDTCSNTANNDKNLFVSMIYGAVGVIYVYLICLLLAGAVETARDNSETRFHRSYNIGLQVAPDWNSLINSAMILVIMMSYSRKRNGIVSWVVEYGSPRRYFSAKCSGHQFISNMFTIWTTILNLVLLVFCNTSILNPGPGGNEQTHLKVMYQNLRGLVPFSSLASKNMPLDAGKLLDLQTKIYKDKPDVVVLTETWLSKEHLDNEILPDNIYKIYRKDRSKRSHPPDPNDPHKYRRKGGGVLIAVKTGIDIENDKVDVSVRAEMISVSLKSNNTCYCISACYRVGTLGEQNLKEIEKHLRNVISRRKFRAHFVVGDFNLPEINWSSSQSTTQLGRNFLDLFNDLGLTQLINQPTHEKGKILDLVLCNLSGVVESLVVHGKNEICSSDHYGVTFKVRMTFRTKISKRKILNYKKADWVGLNNDLKAVRWDDYVSQCDAETGWLRFKDILFHHVKHRIPTITVSDKDQPPWFDSETYQLCLKKERLRAKSNRTGLAEDYKQFSDCRREFKSLIDHKMISNFNDEDDPALISKKFWAHVKSTSKSTRIPGTVNYRGRFRNNQLDQTEMFNEFFAAQFSQESDYDVDIDYSNDSVNDIEFSTSRVRKILKNVNVNKAAGPDGIHGKILKNCRESISYPLSCIFRISYNIGQIPSEWKLANVVPVHKKGPKTLVENYRPISLTCLIMKVFEKIVRDELFAKCQHKLHGSQHGFLPNRSCATQMVGYIESLSLSINDSIRTDVIYFDFAKAFDSVNHDVILRKLKSEFEIDGTLLKFVVNYLKDRKQRVVIGGAQSELKGVQSGVPQGSILGPLFFVLFINDMSECVSVGTKIALYADDTKIWRRIVSWSDHEILQRDIDALQDWAVRNKMKFHPGKCKVLSVSNRTSERSAWSTFPFQVYIYSLNGVELELVPSEKDLGVYVRSDLSWEENILALCTKASSRLGLMKRTLRFIKDRKQKRAFYLALVRSLFENCSIVWRPTNTVLHNRAESIQRRAVKWILGEQDHHYNDYEYLARLRDLDLMPMEQKFKLNDLILFHQIYNDQSVVKLPSYLTPITPSERGRLRTNTRQPSRFEDFDTAGMPNTRQRRINRHDRFSLRCTVEAKAHPFKGSFFFRTHSEWNDLPTELKGDADVGAFKSKLIKHLWDISMAPD